MGYLPHKLRRSRCRAEIRAAIDRPMPTAIAGWMLATPEPPRGPETRYIRLATESIDGYSHQPQGVFHAAYDLRQRITLARRHRQALLDLRDWFGRNLIAPKLDQPRAIFWFRSDAHACIDRIWRMLDVFRQNDIIVTMMHTAHPGTIVYRDEFQVAAVPFRDELPIPRMLPTRRRIRQSR